MSLPVATDSDFEALARDLSLRIKEELPAILRQLLSGQDLVGGPLHLECSLLSGQPGPAHRAVKIACLDISDVATPTPAPTPTPTPTPSPSAAVHPRLLQQDASALESTNPGGDVAHARPSVPTSPASLCRISQPGPCLSADDDNERPAKRRATGGLRIGRPGSTPDPSNAVPRRLESDNVRVFPQRKKRLPDNPNLQPSSLDKFIGGVWESIFSAVRLDPAEVIEQWQAIESSGQPKLLMEHTDNHDLTARCDSAVQSRFGRMNVLTRKISQTSRTCRSLEVIVQAHWVQAFDERVTELTLTMTKEKAKKIAISEACIDFSWTEKELRNKMAIWRGYHDIKSAAGWTALVFAGMGLYRFCKYRVSFTDETFQQLRALRHRFEVAADCLHPRWRSLLAIVGAATERIYTGHPHDWVVCGPEHEAVPLAATYHKWDPNFNFTHLDESAIDEEAWGLYDPRTVTPLNDPTAYQCTICSERQSDDPRHNVCACFPNLYGCAKAGSVPVQVYRTPNGKNNGLLACCAFERGAAIGEFVGQVTSGVANLDVMVGSTDRASYQIWQGRQGNYTRFVNHSCQPNSQFERFIWLGTQRIVLVSKGIEAGEEVTVDYSDTYWKNLDKQCLCESAKCRYRRRSKQLLTPPEHS